MRGRNGADGRPLGTSRLVEAAELAQKWRSEWTPAQAAVMQAVDDAVRAGEVSAEDAAEIETVIRRGHVHGARKRLTKARRRATPS